MKVHGGERKETMIIFGRNEGRFWSRVWQAMNGQIEHKNKQWLTPNKGQGEETGEFSALMKHCCH